MSLNYTYVPSLRRESTAAVAGVLARPQLSLGFMGDTLDSRLTFSRGTYATQYDNQGNLVFAPMNAIRNSTMVGTVAGTPGTLPTNWTNVLVAGITQTILGTGIENGIEYIDIRLFGTPSVSSYINIVPEINTAAVVGQKWTGAFYAKLLAGSFTNSAAFVEVRESDAVQTFLVNNLPPITIDSTLRRFSTTREMTSSTIAYVRCAAIFQHTAGLPIDFTVRIGLPTLELDTITRATNGVYWPPSRTTTAVYYGPRSDYDPTTLQRKGTLIEETRANGIRNNVGVGTVAGTPGTMPTNWLFFPNGITGISSTIVGITQDKGVSCLEIRIFGTPSATVAQGIQIAFEGSNIIAATSSQVWTHSLWCRIVGGSTANISAFNFNTQQYNTGVFVQSNNSPITPTSALTRYSSTVTLSASATTHVVPVLGLATTAGQPIDITLRIGLPQLELGSHASSAIHTYGTQYTRQFDNLDMTSIGSWFNASEGTLYGETVLDRILPTSGNGAFPGIFHIADGTFNNRIVLTAFSPGATNNYYGTVITGGVDQGSLGTNAFSASTVVRGAYAYKANDAAYSANGSAAVLDTTVTLPTGLNIANLGGTLSAGANRLNGWLRNIKYYNTRLSNANLQKLTT